MYPTNLNRKTRTTKKEQTNANRVSYHTANQPGQYKYGVLCTKLSASILELSNRTLLSSRHCPRLSQLGRGDIIDANFRWRGYRDDRHSW